MEYIYAAMILHSADKDINEENVKSIIEAAGIEADDARIKALIAALEDVDIDEAMETTAMAAAPAAAAPAAAEAAVEEEEEEDPRAELVQQLLEYKMYKCMAYELKDRQMDAERIMFKQPTIPQEVLAYEEPLDLDELVSDVTLKKLNDIFQNIMKKQADKIDKVRSKFGKIEKEEVSLEDKMDYLTNYATTHKNFSFRNLLESSSGKIEVIVTFLAILELMKMGRINISQEHIFDDILIESRIAA